MAAPHADSATGRVERYAGAPGVLSASPARLGVWTRELDDHPLGKGLLAGADIDGDGTGDLVMGAVSAWTGLVTKGGRAYVVRGRGDFSGETVSAAPADAAIHGAAVEDCLGRADAAADLDGDGAAELVLGSGDTGRDGCGHGGTVNLFRGGAFP